VSERDDDTGGGSDRDGDGAGSDGDGDGGVAHGLAVDGPLACDTCGATVAVADATRTETMGGLDPSKWQTLCCPDCGSRLQTVFVGLDG
jgi:DNA-directed RNA polymerase subunit RPC12/RpoP